jgi:hypothetical protein
MPNPMRPQTFFIDRAESPVGTMLLIHDLEERLRALDPLEALSALARLSPLMRGWRLSLLNDFITVSVKTKR